MSKIITCIDASPFAEHVVSLSAWLHARMGKRILLLHAVPENHDAKVDMSGRIGLGVKSSLLEELTQADEELGRQEQQKGQKILDRAKKLLKAKDIVEFEIIHRRGKLVEIIQEIDEQTELIVIGKCGEQLQTVLPKVGRNLEIMARSTHKPLLIAPENVRNIQKFMIAYDGSPSAQKVLDFVVNNPLFDGLECHVLTVGDQSNAKDISVLEEAKNILHQGGIDVCASFKDAKSVEEEVGHYLALHKIDLLLIGAYGHSKIRNLIWGSTTTALVRQSSVPTMLFR